MEFTAVSLWMYKPLLCTAGVGWVLNTTSWAGPCHCVWPYNVQATAALDISSSVCLAIKYQSPHTHADHFPFSLKVRDITVLAGSIVWATRRRREKPTVLLGETFQLETDEGENRNRHLPGRPGRAKLLEGALVTERKVCLVKEWVNHTERGVKNVHVSRRTKWSRKRKNQHLTK